MIKTISYDQSFWLWKKLHFQSCVAQDEVTSLNSNKRILRIVKILRILKIIRLIKAVKVVECVFPYVHSSVRQCDWSCHDRTIEDYAVVYLGSALFKVARLVIIAMYTVHFGACIFFRVKMNSAETPEDVTAFYASKHIRDDVRDVGDVIHTMILFPDLLLCRTLQINM